MIGYKGTYIAPKNNGAFPQITERKGAKTGLKMSEKCGILTHRSPWRMIL